MSSLIWPLECFSCASLLFFRPEAIYTSFRIIYDRVDAQVMPTSTSLLVKMSSVKSEYLNSKYHILGCFVFLTDKQVEVLSSWTG